MYTSDGFHIEQAKLPPYLISALANSKRDGWELKRFLREEVAKFFGLREWELSDGEGAVQLVEDSNPPSILIKRRAGDALLTRFMLEHRGHRPEVCSTIEGIYLRCMKCTMSSIIVSMDALSEEAKGNPWRGKLEA